MLNYRIKITRDCDDNYKEIDLLDRVVMLWAVAWVARSVKEVAIVYAKTK